jgi:head-tail adaptor
MNGAGSYREWVTIEKPTKVSDGRGGFTVTWETHWEGPARIERFRSFRGDVERLTKGAVDAHPIVRIHVRYDDETAELLRTGAGMRVINVDEAITMNVNFAQDMNGRRENIVITATEHQPS